MKKITTNIFSRAFIWAFVIGIFQQVQAQKVIVQEWDFETNTQSNNGLEFGWPSSSPGTVSGGTFTVSGADAESGYVNFDDVNSGKITYSISLKSWEVSAADGSYWELRFYDSSNNELARNRITSQNKTSYVGTSVYALYRESGVWVNGGNFYKVGRLNAWHTNTGDPNNGNSGAYGHSLPVTVNFTLDLDADTYTVWVGDYNPVDDDGSLWTIWGGDSPVNTGAAALGAGVSHLKWKWVRAAGASNSGNEFIEIEKISIYTGLAAGLSDDTVNTDDSKVYPTTNQGTFTVALDNQKPALIEVYSTAGALIHTQTTRATKTPVTLSNANGMYFVNISQEGTVPTTHKIIVNQ